jgi:hypothetical protein
MRSIRIQPRGSVSHVGTLLARAISMPAMLARFLLGQDLCQRGQAGRLARFLLGVLPVSHVGTILAIAICVPAQPVRYNNPPCCRGGLLYKPIRLIRFHRDGRGGGPTDRQFF